MMKVTDEQPDEVSQRVRFRRVPSAGASVSIDVVHHMEVMNMVDVFAHLEAP